MASREEPDTQLLARACRGDGGAFAELVGRQHRKVCAYLHRKDPSMRPADLEDMTQEVFARAWRVRHSFRAQASAQTFILSIAKHVLSEHWRKSRSLVDPALQVANLSRERPDSPAELRELMAIVAEALDKLSTKQEEAFRLLLIDDVPAREAALQVGASVKAVRRRAETARSRLRESLSACKSQCSYGCPSLQACPAQSGRTSCLRFLIRRYL